MRHALFRFPATDPDSLPQLRRVLSGAGRPHDYQDFGAGLWGLTWPDLPSELVQKKSWIANCLDGYVYGWLRYCHCELGVRRTRDPSEPDHGTLLVTDRCLRFEKRLPFTPHGNRSYYLRNHELAKMPAPQPDDGDSVVWVGDGTLIHGCQEHPD